MNDIIKVAHPAVGEEEVEAIREVLLSGNFVSGSRVQEFEGAFARYIGCGRAVAVNSGTAALHIALQAMGVGEGDEVIVPPLTFFATVSSVLYLRARPVFADIDGDDLCLSPTDALRRITPRTRAVVPVHLFGNAAKMDAFLEMGKQTGVAIVEDCAQAHGTEYRGRKVGSLGKAGCFSFFATKHMTTGEGGMITTDDEGLAERARMIRNHGMTGRDHHVLLGFNNRMTEMEAAMGLVQLRKLDELNARRIAHSEMLLKEVSGLAWARPLRANPGVRHTYFWCPVMVDEERSGRRLEDLKAHLRRNGVEFRHRYTEPLYRQEVLKGVCAAYGGLHLPNAEAVAGRVLGLPNHPWLKHEELKRIVEVLRAF
jgi:perosamine synthetase